MRSRHRRPYTPPPGISIRGRSPRLSALVVSLAIASAASLTVRAPAALADGSLSITPPAEVISVEGPDGGLPATITLQGTLPTPPAQAGPGAEDGASGYTLYAGVRPRGGRCDPAAPIYDNEHGGIWSEYGVPGAAFNESFGVEGESLYTYDKIAGVQSFPVCAWLAVPDSSDESPIVVAFAESLVSFRRPRVTLSAAFPSHLRARRPFNVDLNAWTGVANGRLYAQVITAAYVNRNCEFVIEATPPVFDRRQWGLPVGRPVKHSLRIRLPAGTYRLCVFGEIEWVPPLMRLLRVRR